MAADWMYAVDVVAPDGNPLPPNAIESSLRAVVSDVGERIKKGEHAVCVSVLTTDDRDRWAVVSSIPTWISLPLSSAIVFPIEPRTPLVSLPVEPCNSPNHRRIRLRP